MRMLKRTESCLCESVKSALKGSSLVIKMYFEKSIANEFYDTYKKEEANYCTLIKLCPISKIVCQYSYQSWGGGGGRCHASFTVRCSEVLQYMSSDHVCVAFLSDIAIVAGLTGTLCVCLFCTEVEMCKKSMLGDTVFFSVQISATAGLMRIPDRLE